MGRTINSAGGKRRPPKGKTTKLRRGSGTARGHGSSAVTQEPEAARLNRELEDALQRQSATAEILKVIAGSPSDVQPVFEAIAASANRLIDGFSTAVCRVIDDVVHLVAFTPTDPESDAALKAAFPLHRSELPHIPLIQNGETVQIADSESANPQTRRLGRIRGWRSIAFTPLMNQGASIGFIACTRRETGVLADHHVQLLRTFADQAVIAIENARLFNEVQARKRDLEEALVHQTGSANILKVIAMSPADIAPVLQAIAKSACEYCDAADAAVLLREGDQLRFRAHHGSIPLLADLRPINRNWVNGRAVIDKIPVHVHDLFSADGDEFPQGREMAAREMIRTILSVPLLREDEAIGTIALRRIEAHPFSDRQIALLRTFADQAVIAIQNVKLFDEVRARTRDLEESLQQQTATADVLKVISRSAFDLHTVLDALLASACRLCEAEIGTIRYQEGGDYRLAATFGCKPQWIDHLSHYPAKPDRGSIFGRTIVDGRTVHFPDVLADPDFQRQSAQNLMGFRAALGVPLVRDGQAFGVISLLRLAIGPFSEKQIELIQTFADQAVIAIENVRLITETREALERQTATAEVLQAINSSPGDLTPVFEMILEKAHGLCAVALGTLLLYDGEKFRAVAVRGFPETFAAGLRRGFVPGPNLPHHRLLEGARFAQVADWAEIDDPLARDSLNAGVRTTLFIPLRREGALLGYIAASRAEVIPFTEKEITLLESFGAQAVIAMENARLLGELRERQAELARSVDELTATADVLKVISRSSVDLKTVLETLCETVARLCRADQTPLYRRRDDKHHLAAAWGMSEEARQFALAHPLTPGRGTVTGRVMLERRAVHMPDVLQDPEYTYSEGQKAIGYRTLLGIPLLREDALLGVFAISRTRVEPFTDKEIELATSFADQAVIAIENAQLFEELRQSLQQQTATADVLKVISQSAFDLGTVLQTLVESAAHLCEADKATISRKIGEFFYRAETYGFSDEFMDYVKDIPIAPERGSAHGRVLLEGKPVHILDVEADPEFTFVDASRLDGFRTVLAVPILREGVPIGALALTRSEVRAFTDKQIELVLTFADQAAIAIENARLVGELRERQAELRVTFDNMGDGVVMFDGSTRLTAWNRNLQEILELPDAFLSQRPTFAESSVILLTAANTLPIWKLTLAAPTKTLGGSCASSARGPMAALSRYVVILCRTAASC